MIQLPASILLTTGEIPFQISIYYQYSVQIIMDLVNIKVKDLCTSQDKIYPLANIVVSRS